MAKEIAIIQEKLDKLMEVTANTNTKVAVIEEHLKAMNGRLLEHDEEIEEGKKSSEKNANDITFAKGSIYALTLFGILISLFLGLKQVGLI